MISLRARARVCVFYVVCRYVIRQGVTSWFVFYMLQEKGALDAGVAAQRVSGLELGGLVGSLLAGRLSDMYVIYTLSPPPTPTSLSFSASDVRRSERTRKKRPNDREKEGAMRTTGGHSTGVVVCAEIRFARA